MAIELTLLEALIENVSETYIIISSCSSLTSLSSLDVLWFRFGFFGPILFSVLLMLTSTLRPCWELLEMHTTRSTKWHWKDSWTHLIHLRTASTTTSHCLRKHLLERIDTSASPSTPTTMHAMHLRTKGLSENFLDTTIAEELSKDVFRVDVVELWASARTHILTKHIIVFTFARIAQARIGRVDFLESFLCTRCSIFVRMYFESELLEKRTHHKHKSK